MARDGNTKEGGTIRKKFRNEVGDESDRPTKWKEKGGREKWEGEKVRDREKWNKVIGREKEEMCIEKKKHRGGQGRRQDGRRYGRFTLPEEKGGKEFIKSLSGWYLDNFRHPRIFLDLCVPIIGG